MRIRLLPDARKLIRKAWSLRFIALGFVAVSAEAAVSVFGMSILPGPRWVQLGLIALVFGGAFLARLMPQPDID